MLAALRVFDLKGFDPTVERLSATMGGVYREEPQATGERGRGCLMGVCIPCVYAKDTKCNNYIYILTYVYIYIIIYIYMCVYTYIYTYKYIYITNETLVACYNDIYI